MRSASLIAVAAGAGVLAGGCGGALNARAPVSRRAVARAQATPIPTASCVRQPLAPAPLPHEVGVYRAGPLILAAGDDLAQQSEEWRGRRSWGSEAIAVLSDGTGAVRFPACGRRLHRFGGAILFRGTGCARLHVTVGGRAPIPMLIPIGDTLRGCPAPSPLASLARSALPFLGVSCPYSNSIACDRVGVGVRMSREATLVVVRVVGRLVTLSPPTGRPPDDLWLGYLYDAGLRHGALHVHIPRGTHLWLGSPPVYARVRVTAFFCGGEAASLSGTVPLHPGFG